VKKATGKTPVRRKKSPSQPPAGTVRRLQKTVSPASPESVPPSAPNPEKPAAAKVSAVSGDIIETPIGISEIVLDGSADTSAGFLDSAGSSRQTGESLLGNLPAVRQVGEPLEIGGNAANGEEEKTSLLDKISGLHQDGDDSPDRG